LQPREREAVIFSILLLPSHHLEREREPFEGGGLRGKTISYERGEREREEKFERRRKVLSNFFIFFLRASGGISPSQHGHCQGVID
jgi:hypothetical protein